MSAQGVAPQGETFHVRKSDLHETRWGETVQPGQDTLRPGQLVAEVTKFAFTANNITYARTGEQLGYWRFFAAPDGWGVIPVWGIAKVRHSRAPGIEPGERIYGYMPMASDVLLEVGEMRGVRFSDVSAPRASLAPTYNEYVLIDRDPDYRPAQEDAHLILRPLFALSFFCAHYLQENALFGARRVIISSASSKAAMGLAFLLARGDPGIEIVGLTSPGHVAFVEANGRYARMLTYEAISSLAEDTATIFVDIAGNDVALSAVHSALPRTLMRSIRAGFTHGDPTGAEAISLPGPTPEFFFTPDHILRLRREWGREVLKQRLASEWQAFLDYSEGWLRIEAAHGKAAVERVYQAVLNGVRHPAEGDILTIAER